MRLKKIARLLVLMAALSLLFSQVVLGWPWNTDMFWQQSVRAQERPPSPPPDQGMALDQEPEMTREEAGRILENPFAPLPGSVDRGKWLYEQFCYPCHGQKGYGDGPVARKFVSPANLSLPMYVKMTDGYIYGTIRNGAINMPPQGAALDSMERWHVVNYVRSLQSR